MEHSQASTGRKRADNLGNAGPESKAHACSQDPTPNDGSRAANQEGSVKCRGDTRAETHDTEREADL
jgi:hypothetical protein